MDCVDVYKLESGCLARIPIYPQPKDIENISLICTRKHSTLLDILWSKYIEPLFLLTHFDRGFCDGSMAKAWDHLGKYIKLNVHFFHFYKIILAIDDHNALLYIQEYIGKLGPSVKSEIFILDLSDVDYILTPVPNIKVFRRIRYNNDLEKTLLALVYEWKLYTLSFFNFSRYGLIPREEQSYLLGFNYYDSEMWIYFESYIHLYGLAIRRNFEHIYQRPNLNYDKVLNEDDAVRIFKQWLLYFDRTSDQVYVLNNMFNIYHSFHFSSEQIQILIREWQSKMKIDKYRREIPLANEYLKTSIHGDNVKLLLSNGHGNEDFQSDLKQFRESLRMFFEKPITDEDVCCITMSSTLSDMMNIMKGKNYSNKYEFLRYVTVSGVGVSIDTKNDLYIESPWSYTICKILPYPYTIVSQVAMEVYVQLHGVDSLKSGKRIPLGENALFNSVIPLFNRESAKFMKPLVTTRLFNMCASYAILKNPLIINETIHFASLAVLWVHKLGTSHSKILEDIEATAKLYLDHYTPYKDLLVNDLSSALLLANSETIIKPIFILRLFRKDIQMNMLFKICQQIIIEYIRRCLTKKQNRVVVDIKKYFSFNNGLPYVKTKSLNSMSFPTLTGDMTFYKLKLAVAQILNTKLGKFLFKGNSLVSYFTQVITRSSSLPKYSQCVEIFKE